MVSPKDENALAGQGGTLLNKALKLSQPMNIDVKAVRDLGGAFQAVARQLKDLKKELDAVQASADKAASSVASVGGGTGSAGGTKIGATQMVTALKTSSTTTGAAAQGTAAAVGGGGGGGGIGGMLKGMMGGGGGGGVSAGVAAGATVAGAAFTQALATIDARVDRNRDYALSADRMSVLYQQMTGLNQVQVQDRYRQPLTNYRLGAGGINTLLDLQSRTGINAAQQASSVEAMRTYSGFSISTEGAASMLQNLASAPIANRMFLMGGGGLIGAGGKQNTMQSVMENVVKSAGLTNEKLVDSAFAQGSLTRAKLEMMGVTGDMQDQVLQYAKQNIQYQKKGGAGMYNAADKKARQLMGIEDNFATQAEETDRVRTAREEQMYSRQADNYADLEKQTQKLVKVFGALEDKLSGIIGARTSNRISSQIGGTIGTGIGAAIGSLIVPGAGTAVGAVLGNIGGTMLGGLIGEQNSDGKKKPSTGGTTGSKTYTGNDATTFVPVYGANNKPRYASIESIKTRPDFIGMKSQMKDRVLRMMRANPKVGFGQGIRDQKQQHDLFFQRYKKTDRPDSTERINEKDRKYQGYWWELKNPGDNPAAAPGNSMHGAGLAVDLYLSDAEAQAWAYAHAAEFGLAGAGSIDPPHFQPIEFANDSVKSYLAKGAPWGTDGIDTSADAPSPIGGSPTAPEASTDPSAPGTLGVTPVAIGGSTTGLSISERVAADMGMVSGIGGVGSTDTPTEPTPTATTTSTSGPAAGALSGEEVARMLYGVGFRGSQLIKMLAISKRESGWSPTAHNPDASTGDNSWGLFQLNTLGDLWNYYKGKGLSRPEELLDPNTNVRMAKALFDDNVRWKSNGFYPWGDYPGSGPGSSDGNIDIPAATAIVKSAGLGEAYDSMPTKASAPSSSKIVQGSNTMSVHGGHTFNINPNITITGSGNSNIDLKKLASELARLVKHEIEVQALRGN